MLTEIGRQSIATRSTTVRDSPKQSPRPRHSRFKAAEPKSLCTVPKPRLMAASAHRDSSKRSDSDVVLDGSEEELMDSASDDESADESPGTGMLQTDEVHAGDGTQQSEISVLADSTHDAGGTTCNEDSSTAGDVTPPVTPSSGTGESVTNESASRASSLGTQDLLLASSIHTEKQHDTRDSSTKRGASADAQSDGDDNNGRSEAEGGAGSHDVRRDVSAVTRGTDTPSRPACKAPPWSPT